MIAFKCPKCKTSLQYDDIHAGQKIACPQCQQRVRIPQSEDRTLMGELIPTQSSQAPVISARSSHPSQPLSSPSLPQTIRCVCPHCHTSMNARASFAGTRIACPSCQKPIDIPATTKTQGLPQVVVNVVNTVGAFAGAASHPQTRPVPPLVKKSSGLLTWLVVALVLVIGGGGGLYLLGKAGYGPFKPTPQDLIVGKWERYNKVTEKNVQMIFYTDGEMEFITPGKFAEPRSRYRFIDDTHIEMISPDSKETQRLEVSFRSNDELVLTLPGNTTIAFDRVK